MDTVVLVLASSGLALTAGGVVTGTRDVASRVRAYRTAAATAPRVTFEDPRLRALSGGSTVMIGAQLGDETRARELAEQRLAAAAGVTTGLRRLWLSAAVAFAGVLLSGAADIVAAVHATG